MKDLTDIIPKSEPLTPLLKYACERMPDSFRRIILTPELIAAIADKSREIRGKNKEFVRSDIGQLMGILPDLEVYYGSSVGLQELRASIAELWTITYKLAGKHELLSDGLKAENIAITTGAIEALVLIFRMLASKQKVGIVIPYWPNYLNCIQNAEAEYVPINLFDARERLDLANLKRVIKKQNIKVLLINFPNNPSGRVLKTEQMQQLAQFAKELDIILVSDEVYNRLRYEGVPQTMLTFAPERTLVIGSASKEYLMAGGRIGYVISASKTITDVFFRRLIRSNTACPNVIGQQRVLEIMKKELQELRSGKDSSYIAGIVKQLRERRDLLAKILQNFGFGLACNNSLPGGSIYILAKLPESVKVSDTEFLSKAIEMEKFSAVPGSACGMPGWVRFSFGSMPISEIEKMPERLKDVLASFGA
jgi:aspartate aminotransferase